MEISENRKQATAKSEGSWKTRWRWGRILAIFIGLVFVALGVFSFVRFEPRTQEVRASMGANGEIELFETTIRPTKIITYVDEAVDDVAVVQNNYDLDCASRYGDRIVQSDQNTHFVVFSITYNWKEPTAICAREGDNVAVGQIALKVDSYLATPHSYDDPTGASRSEWSWSIDVRFRHAEPFEQRIADYSLTVALSLVGGFVGYGISRLWSQQDRTPSNIPSP